MFRASSLMGPLVENTILPSGSILISIGSGIYPMSVTRDSGALRFGAFLVALGLGWLVFSTYAVEISAVFFAVILVIAGISVVVSALISWRRPNLPVGGLVGAIVGGLILSLFLTNGLGFIQGFMGGRTFWANTAEGTKSFSGIVTASRVYFEVENINGPVRLSTWERTQYSVNLTIRA